MAAKTINAMTTGMAADQRLARASVTEYTTSRQNQMTPTMPRSEMAMVSRRRRASKTYYLSIWRTLRTVISGGQVHAGSEDREGRRHWRTLG